MTRLSLFSRLPSLASSLGLLLSLSGLWSQAYNLADYLPYGPGDESVLTSNIGFDLVFTGGADATITWDAADGVQEGLRQVFQWSDSGLMLLAEDGVLPDGTLAYAEDYAAGFVVMPASFDAEVEFTNTATYSGVEGLDSWTGTATSTFTVIDELTAYVLPGTFTALRVQLVIDWEEIGTGFTAHGTQTLVWWMVKDYGMARMNFISGESVTETGQSPENDYVSIIFSLESTNLIPTIEIPDPGLEAAIRASLRKTEGELTLPDMESLTGLNTNDRGITDLTGLEMAINLSSLTLSFNEIEDLSPLAGLSMLKTLKVDRNRIRDLSPIAGLTTITFLDIWTNRVTDVTPIAGLVDLYRLDLRNNSIADITPLATLESLTHVQVQANFLDLGEGSPNAAIIAGWDKPGTEVFVSNQYTPAPAEANFRLEIVEGEPRFTYEPEPGGLYRIALSPDMADWVGPYEFVSGIFGTPRLDFPLLDESETDEMYYRLMVSFLD